MLCLDNSSKEQPSLWETVLPPELFQLNEELLQLQQGATIALISKKIGVSAHTYYRWRKEYGGMRVDQARRLKELEQENSRLKKLVADLSLDNAILKEASRGNF